MSSYRDYRSEAQAARRSARETLIAFRNARRQAKGIRYEGETRAHQSNSGTSSIPPEALFDMTSNHSLASTDLGQPPTEMLNTEQPIDGLKDEISGMGEDSHLPKWDAALAEEIGTNAMTELGSDSNGTLARDESAAERLEMLGQPPTRSFEQSTAPMSFAVEPSESISDPGPETAKLDQHSDLFTLPGAGAGVVWMFQRCGIRMLSDLAKADAVELSAELGVVGHILNIEPWIAFAREADDALRSSTQ